VVEGSCVSQTCIASGTGCDATCNWGDVCDSCCTGYCNSSGVCGDEPPGPLCIADGELCPDNCSWSNGCDACCGGYCNGSGICSEPGASAGACGDEGCQCAENNPCNEGLLCCDDGSGVRGICQASC